MNFNLGNRDPLYTPLAFTVVFFLNYLSWGSNFVFLHAQGFPELGATLLSHPESEQLQAKGMWQNAQGPATVQEEHATWECVPARAFPVLSETSKRARTQEERNLP